jgi:hypothetical protein
MSASRHSSPPSSGEAETPLEEREVRAADPQLSPRTNERLTEEMREVIGTTSVRVPADRPHMSAGERPQDRAVPFLSMNRLSFLFGVAAALVIGGIVALTTGDWWFLPLAVGLHALGTMLVVMLSVRLTAVSERPSPELAAAMTEEGVRTPDQRFSEMVDEFREVPEGSIEDTLSQEPGDRSTPAHEDPARAGSEQVKSWTATSGPSEKAPAGGTPDFLLWAVAYALVAFSIAIPAAFGGGWIWLTAAVIVPLVLGWSGLQLFMLKRPDHAEVHGRIPFVVTIVLTVAAVAIFCAIVALAYQGNAPR